MGEVEAAPHDVDALGELGAFLCDEMGDLGACLFANLLAVYTATHCKALQHTNFFLGVCPFLAV